MPERQRLAPHQLNAWAKHWVAMKLIERGWSVKLPAKATAKFALIATHTQYGNRSVKIAAIGRNTGAIDLGPVAEFSADLMVFVDFAGFPEVEAYVHSGNLVKKAPTSDLATGPFVIDRQPKAKNGKVHVWTIHNLKSEQRFPDPAHRDAWHLLEAECCML